MIIKSESELTPKSNAAKCLTCGTIICSTYRHDWQACKCPDDSTSIFVDGGEDYRRFGWGPEAKWLDWIAGEWKEPRYDRT